MEMINRVTQRLGTVKAVGRIGYEFEVERETRYAVQPMDAKRFAWTTHVEDTYDASGRCRIRVKDGKPRLSLKVPLLSQDTATSKVCIRLEFKPETPEQERDLLAIRDRILGESGTQRTEKWGTRIEDENGQRVWLNRDREDRWWFELDEGMTFDPPGYLTVLGVTRGTVAIER